MSRATKRIEETRDLLKRNPTGKPLAQFRQNGVTVPCPGKHICTALARERAEMEDKE